MEARKSDLREDAPPPPQITASRSLRRRRRACVLYTARNATDLLQVVDVPLQIVNKLQQVCGNQSFCNLSSADLLQVVTTTCIKLVANNSDTKTCSKPVEHVNADASCKSQTCCNLIFADLL